MNAYAKAAAARDPERERLIAEHLEMARRIALRVARRTPDWLTPDDLVGAALIGLTEAADRYDAARGEPFVAFAEKRVRGAVLDELRRGDLLPRRARADARRVGRAIRQLEHALGRAPDDEEVAAALGVDVEHYREELAQLTHVDVIELDPAVPHAAEAPSPAAEAERAQMIGRLHACLEKIPERDAQLLQLYYVEELSYLDIGHVLGVSESRVCQLHARAIARLKAAVDDPEGE